MGFLFFAYLIETFLPPFPFCFALFLNLKVNEISLRRVCAEWSSVSVYAAAFQINHARFTSPSCLLEFLRPGPAEAPPAQPRRLWLPSGGCSGRSPPWGRHRWGRAGAGLPSSGPTAGTGWRSRRGKGTPRSWGSTSRARLQLCLEARRMLPRLHSPASPAGTGLCPSLLPRRSPGVPAGQDAPSPQDGSGTPK